MYYIDENNLHLPFYEGESRKEKETKIVHAMRSQFSSKHRLGMS